MPPWKTGDLVWVNVLGYPKWPGQLMDPANALSSVRAKGASGRILVSFFGDNSYGWFKNNVLEDFQQNFAKNSAAKPSKVKIREVFQRATEEAKEVQDRREGKQPATQHEPLDFLQEAPQYDASLVVMDFDEQFPPLPDKVAVSLDPRTAVQDLRLQARCPGRKLSGFSDIERFLVWFRFHMAPEAVRKKIAPKYAVQRKHVEPKKERLPIGRRKLASCTPWQSKNRTGQSAGQQRKAQASGPHGSPNANRPNALWKGKRQNTGKPMPECELDRGGNAATHSGGEHDSGQSGDEQAAAKGSCLISPLGANAVSTHDQQPQADWTCELKHPVVRQGTWADKCPWTEGLRIQPVATERVQASLTPAVQDAVADLEDKLQDVCVPLAGTKVRMRKLLLRIRQCARNADRVDGYDQVLNAHNLAGLYKLREGARWPTPGQGWPNREAAQSTRDAMVLVWRELQEDKVKPSPLHGSAEALSGMQLLSPEPRRRFLPSASKDMKTFICVEDDVPVHLSVYRHLAILQPAHEHELLNAVRAFWRARGSALPVLVKGRMMLDVPEAFRQVAIRGGFWACTAAQGSGANEHLHEAFTAWRAIAQGTWVGSAPITRDDLPWIAADLQEFYRTWLLPFELQLAGDSSSYVHQLTLPAGLIRRLAIERTQDSVLRSLVKMLAEHPDACAQGQMAEDAALQLVGSLLATKLSRSEVEELLSDFYKAPVILAAIDNGPGKSTAVTAPVHGAVSKAAHARAGATLAAESQTEISADSEDSDDRETIPGPRWARHRPRPRSAVSKPPHKQSLEEIAEGRRQRRKATTESFLDVPSESLPHQSPSQSSKETTANPWIDSTTGSAPVNPLKRQRHPSAVPETKPVASALKSSQMPCSVQVCFDPKYPMPTVAQVELAVQQKFSLVPNRTTAIAPLDKFMMLTFQSTADAKAAARELPALLRRQLQMHTAYSIRCHTMTVNRGMELVRDAAARRRSTRADDAAASATQHGMGYQAGPQQPPQRMAVTRAPQPAAAPVWHAQQPMGPVYTMPAGVPMAPTAPTRPSLPGAVPHGGGAAAHPLPGGFLPQAGQAPTTNTPAAADEAELGPAVEDVRAHDAAKTGTASAGTKTAMPDLGGLAAILQNAKAGGEDRGRGSSDKDASGMLGLLQQLGSTQAGQTG